MLQRYLFLILALAISFAGFGQHAGRVRDSLTKATARMTQVVDSLRKEVDRRYAVVESVKKMVEFQSSGKISDTSELPGWRNIYAAQSRGFDSTLVLLDSSLGVLNMLTAQLDSLSQKNPKKMPKN